MNQHALTQYVTQCEKLENLQVECALLDYKAQLCQVSKGRTTVFCSVYGCQKKHVRGHYLRLWVFPNRESMINKNVRYFFCLEHYTQRYQLQEQDTKQYKILITLLEAEKKAKRAAAKRKENPVCAKQVLKLHPLRA